MISLAPGVKGRREEEFWVTDIFLLLKVLPEGENVAARPYTDQMRRQCS